MRWIFALVLGLLSLVAAPARGADYYIDFTLGLGVGTGTAADPWGSWEDAEVAGAFQENGATFYCGSMTRDRLRIQSPGEGLRFTQWPGKPQWGVRLDRVIANGQLVYSGTAGVFTLAIANGTVDNIIEGVATVVVNWDASIDAQGRHYGHLQLSTTATPASMPNDSFHFAKNGSGGGTLSIKLAEGFTSNAAITAAGLTLAWVPGNQNCVEIGTPTYTEYPTFGAYTDDNRNVKGLVIEYGHFYLAADSGFRQRLDSGAGEPGSTNVGTRSIGYGIRIADGDGCTIRGCTMIDNGYHQWMFVGDLCRNNTAEDVVAWGGGNNPFAGNSTGAFYTGPAGLGNKNIAGCVARRCTAYVYTFLGRNGDPIPYPYNGSGATLNTGTFYGTSNGFLAHTNTATGTTNGVEPGGVKYLNCRVVFSGKLSDGTLQTGSAFYGTEIGAWPIADETDWRSYPIQAIDCEVVNGTYNLCSGSGSVAFVRSKLDFARMGIAGLDLSGVSTPQGGNLGSISGTNKMLFVGCEITANTDNGTRYVAAFQSHATNRTVLINCSLMMTGTVATGRKIFFNMNNGSGGVLARGNIFGFRTNHGSNVQYLTYGLSGSNYTTTRVDFLDNVYFNVSTGSYAQFDGTNPNTEALWASTIDPNGIYLGTDVGGATAVWKNPFSDISGQRLEPAGQLRARVKPLALRAEYGINGRSYSGHYGARQYGPHWVLPEAVYADPRYTRPIP